MNTLDQLIDMLKEEKRAAVLHCNATRLYYDAGKWRVVGKYGKRNEQLYCGLDFVEAVKVLKEQA